ncbi:HTH-type transcriptional activator AmpR [Pseudovibrio axinellae]|uniref:HTH-type transcriptional activator AmpR n=1 Tax=Pseudovibrio axinellae TaxID=989403 RepID=A0A165SXE6_9HYPH|nr:LysR family transcriptional regulator [Pseudovibrio axinellae]KZL04611.1 HTH-type transcriptional activator AmpR [Pseudovibrio axinellae]SEQ71400.1 LysR family transcriptional regulator, regulator of gene expression of beta-lactamase [Pseudovibrio axinellae]
MDRPKLPLNALRAFEVAARQGSFTRAAIELCVTQAAVSHQLIALEEFLGVTLFTRTPKGLMLTDEGAALHPVLTQGFDNIGSMLDRLLDGRYQETLNVGVVTTFATGYLLERLPDFRKQHPSVNLRLFTNNNRVDIAKEGLDLAIRFGEGLWPALHATALLTTPLTPLCSPQIKDSLKTPADLVNQTLLRSYRADEWELWFQQAATACPKITGPVFDSSIAMAEMVEAGHGVALLPYDMFTRKLSLGHLCRPFPMEIVTGKYWLTRIKTKPVTPAITLFENWLTSQKPLATLNPASHPQR